MSAEPSTILVIDDDDDAREIFRSVLRDAGHRVVVARSGRLALDVLRLFTPDMIVLDLHMPDFDGWAFDRERARHPRLSQVPLIVVSAFDHSEGRLYEIDAKCFFRKPIDIPLFLTVVGCLAHKKDVSPEIARRVGRDQLLAQNR